ncbi:MAG: dihydroorotate dehydrogenase-like protein [Bacteroidales bacterium]|nr:dihydroorotate dehydrogenase-like protein [Bacteroidales bacterium]
MADISTTYLGLKLKSPIIAGSSPLTDNVKSIKKLADEGVGAVVLKSLFEEQIMMDVDALQVNNINETYSDIERLTTYFTKQKSVNEYLTLIREAKKETDIPIIASINCFSPGEWIDFAAKVEEAGADALELNIFLMPASIEFTGADYEKSYFDLIDQVTKKVNIPISIKIGSYFSGMANFLHRLSQTGIQGMVLFNRFYDADINIENESLTSRPFDSHTADNSNVLRWIGILSPYVSCDLAASTGVVDGDTMIKDMLAGAAATQVVSALLTQGTGLVKKMNERLSEWMDKKGYIHTNDFIGKLNQKNVRKPILFERTQFMKYFSNLDYVSPK